MIEYLRENLLQKVQKEVDSLGEGGLKGKISDGYHTFDELYEHRIELWITLCRMFKTKINGNGIHRDVWRTRFHSDGSFINDWFLLGLGNNSHYGSQITYHLPMTRWYDCQFADTLDKAPDFDGHTSADVIKRLSAL